MSNWIIATIDAVSRCKVLSGGTGIAAAAPAGNDGGSLPLFQTKQSKSLDEHDHHQG
jgi:hypothetical protein